MAKTKDRANSDAELSGVEKWLDEADPATLQWRDGEHSRRIIAARQGVGPGIATQVCHETGQAPGTGA